jgi:hypothetical protein
MGSWVPKYREPYLNFYFQQFEVGFPVLGNLRMGFRFPGFPRTEPKTDTPIRTQAFEELVLSNFKLKLYVYEDLNKTSFQKKIQNL